MKDHKSEDNWREKCVFDQKPSHRLRLVQFESENQEKLLHLFMKHVEYLCIYSGLWSGPRGHGRPGNTAPRPSHVVLMWSVHPAGLDPEQRAASFKSPSTQTAAVCRILYEICRQQKHLKSRRIRFSGVLAARYGSDPDNRRLEGHRPC